MQDTFIHESYLLLPRVAFRFVRVDSFPRDSAINPRP